MWLCLRDGNKKQHDQYHQIIIITIKLITNISLAQIAKSLCSFSLHGDSCLELISEHLFLGRAAQSVTRWGDVSLEIKNGFGKW